MLRRDCFLLSHHEAVFADWRIQQPELAVLLVQVVRDLQVKRRKSARDQNRRLLSALGALDY